jgi:hypothetical protein
MAIMKQKSSAPGVPHEVIRLTDYPQLELYLTKFARGELGLVLLLGRPGTGKSESVKRALSTMPATADAADSRRTLYVEGHVQPYGLYRQLWEFRDRPVVLDDLDRLYADPQCVRLLKPLCNTTREKRIHWLTRLTMDDEQVPSGFTTASNVILIANEWKSLNPNVRALEDRAIILHFCPSNAEVHRKVGEWRDDREVYAFIGDLLTVVPEVSMRHYCKASQLRKAGLADWRNSLLQMTIPDRRIASVVALRHDPSLQSEADRITRFTAETGASRATYFRIKTKLDNRP